MGINKMREYQPINKTEARKTYDEELAYVAIVKHGQDPKEDNFTRKPYNSYWFANFEQEYRYLHNYSGKVDYYKMAFI